MNKMIRTARSVRGNHLDIGALDDIVDPDSCLFAQVVEDQREDHIYGKT